MSNEFFVQYQGTPKTINFKRIFVDADEVSASWVEKMRRKTSLFAYCSVGTWENWRKDAKDFPAASLGSGVDGWVGEKWLKNNSKLFDIYVKRVNHILALGFDGIDFDNVEICEREPSIKPLVKNIISYAKTNGLLISLRSYHSGEKPFCYLAEEVKSQNTFNSYKPKALLYNLEYKSVAHDDRFITAVTSLVLDGKKWRIV